MKIEKTCMIGRYNLVDENLETEDRYIRQIDTEELITLAESVLELFANEVRKR